MEIKIKDISATKKEMEVIIPPEKIAQYTEKAAQIISSESMIDGFRPGKAPKDIIEEKFGKEKVWQEACNQVINDTCFQILKENNFALVSQPNIVIESMELQKPLTYKIIFEIFPEIVLPDYKKIAKEITSKKTKVEVSKEELDETLKYLQDSRAKVMAVNRESQKGDEVVVEFEGLIDGIKQGGLTSEKSSFILGEEKFIKGFDDQLIGLKSGESKTFSLENEVLNAKGKKEKKNIEFQVKVHSVSKRELPEINDEFAKSLGNFSDLKDLKTKLTENIKTEKELKEKEKTRMAIIEAILKQSSLEVPESLIEKELDYMIEDFKTRLSQMGFSFEEYLNRAKKTKEDFRKSWLQDAKKRVQTQLILEEIAERENIEVKDEEVIEETNNLLIGLNKSESNLPDPEKLKVYVKNLLKNEKVFQFLEEQTNSD